MAKFDLFLSLDCARVEGVRAQFFGLLDYGSATLRCKIGFLSLDCARVEGVGAQSKERKGSNFAAQRSGAIVP